MTNRILLIDSDQATVDALLPLLAAHGFNARHANSGQAGLRSAHSQPPDLVLLEAQLPDMDGFELCRRLRDRSDMPIIFISALARTDDIVAGLDAGADDYLRKPYADEELLARIRARIRGAPQQRLAEELVFRGGDLRINLISREVIIGGQLRHLTPKEFNLLAALARNAGRVMSREELVRQAWGERYADVTDSLKLYIHYLRRKIEPDPVQPQYILTSRGVGYRFVRR